MKRRSIINSERNCSHCVFFKQREYSLDGSLAYGKCVAEGTGDIIKYHGVLCERFEEDPKNPVPRYWDKLTEEQKEAIKYLRSKDKERRRPIKVYKEKTIEKPSYKKVARYKKMMRILKTNEEVKNLVDQLFKLKKRNSKEGRTIRRKLRKLGYYLSQKTGKVNDPEVSD
ncbi:MAG: hypothetical protein K6T87_16115 [Roseiflexus sp.]|uniref:hypothetical protein n=1 Tax=Roseiflexus sp. TaxID=2562120 RepID=UPI0025E52D5A|nr:hypothetical protein [Roseiflexus sp.]MCL6542082.1 hypothetical protein [Roseiflexus sp.]